ncbi:hypothetical protein [Billgrantia montanilacus]|uniref:hypothetical protein n=1 Tax=Billgrantia montanilacus TaxID=2282305 RepID=UPI0011C0567D|nr:hypothetical protein [Halomonas montanilacus]
MPKQIQRDHEIYIAPGILGLYENDSPVAIDQLNDQNRLDPTNVDDKITIYEREVTGWFLEPALKLLDEDSFQNAFIVLMVCMSYLEGVEQYKTGIDSNRRSKDCFVESLERLYPDQFHKRDLEKLYSKSRCGLFHNGMVKGGVVFSSEYDNVMSFSNNAEIIKINSRLLLNRIRQDFSSYINELRSEEQSETIRDNFNRIFSVL